ncbi:MAG: ATP-binding protein [Promethearchaeota archaeon]
MRIIKLFKKELKDIDEYDISQIETNPMNFESLTIEYKVKFDGNAAELIRDIVQFANGYEEGYILFGISDDPISIIGIEKNEIEGLKNIINDLLPKRIEPLISPFPQYQAVPLASGKYVFIIKIFPKEYGIYGIRQSDDMNNRNYYRYEFYRRLDGNKHRMNIESVVELIESKNRGLQKQLSITIHGSYLLAQPGHQAELYIGIKAVNKSVRPIIINSYLLEIPEKEKRVLISPFHPEHLMICSRLPYKLEDGESCQAYLSRQSFEETMNQEGWSYPLKIRGVFGTNDGEFLSEIIELKDRE